MLRILRFWCVLIFYLLGCKGIPIADTEVDKVFLENERQHKGAVATNSETIQQLYSLLNESVLKETLSSFSLTVPQQEDAQTVSANILAMQSSTERLYTSKPNFGTDNVASEETKLVPQKLGSPLLHEQSVFIQDRIEEAATRPIQEPQQQKFATKSPLEYQTRRPSYASAPGGISGGDLGQLIPSGAPLPAGLPQQNIAIVDRIKETTTTKAVQEQLLTKSPLEYQTNRPSFASAPGGISGGHLGQLIPLGDPLPAGPIQQNISIVDRVKETTPTTTQELLNLKPSTKSPLEYQSKRPAYASAPGGISGGHLGQLIPLGDPLPAGPIQQNCRPSKETTPTTTQELLNQKPSTKSPLEYQSKRPAYAGAPGGISGGHLGQLIPSGDPLPAGPPQQNIPIVDRFKETTFATTIQVLPSKESPTKSPLEYQTNRPSYASAPGGISGGHLGQLIPLGDPLPAGPIQQNISIVDRAKETTPTTTQALLNQKPSTKSPLEYQSKRPAYAGAPGGILGGHLGQLIPSGDPLPAGPPQQNIPIVDRFKETTFATTIQVLPSKESPTKSPLEYETNRPSYASAPGGISGGHLGQLIPLGDPLPSSPMQQNISIVDRVKETTPITIQQLPNQKPHTKSPLEYQYIRPTYAGAPGGISGGHLGQLIPSGDPLPAGPLQQNIIVQDRFKETTTSTIVQKPSTKSPLEYQHQRPVYAGEPGGISGGNLGPLIPPGKPWPANPPRQNLTIEDRFKETTTAAPQEVSTKPPVIFQPQGPPFTGIFGGLFGQYKPPTWPIIPPPQKPVTENEIRETTVTPVQSSRRPQATTLFSVGYKPQKPSYTGQLSSGSLGQLIPSGKPWPAS